MHVGDLRVAGRGTGEQQLIDAGRRSFTGRTMLLVKNGTVVVELGMVKVECG